MSKLFTTNQEADAAPINAQQYDDTAAASANAENDAEPSTAVGEFDTAGANAGQEEVKSGNAASTKKKGMRGFFF